MDTATLGRAYESRRLLDAPYDELRKAGLLQYWPPTITYSALCAGLRYTPRRFPGHREFMQRSGLAEWLKRALVFDFDPEESPPEKPTMLDKKAVKKSASKRVPPKRGRT